ncbi:MAG: substrate-binding domain-containing protein, partial [Acidiferrobacter sp.]
MVRQTRTALQSALWALSLVSSLHAAQLSLSIQPVLGQRATHKAFAPLARYLGQLLGDPCHIITSPNFIVYWQNMGRQPGPTFVLDAAHFTDYRLQHLGYHLLVKEPGTVSYSLVVRGSEMVLGPSALVGLPVASLGIPSMGAALLNRMFPHPTRRPIVVGARDAAAEFRLLATHKVDAAMIPTPLVAQAMA